MGLEGGLSISWDWSMIIIYLNQPRSSYICLMGNWIFVERPQEMLGFMKEKKCTYFVGLKREQNEDKGGVYSHSFSQIVF